MRKFILLIYCTLLSSFYSYGQVDLSSFQPYNTQGDNLIHVVTADFDAVGAKDYVVALTVEGKLIAFQRPDRITSPEADNRLWEYNDLPSMGIRIFAEDFLAAHSGDEIILPGTDGRIRIFSGTGQLLIDKQISTGALYTATVGQNDQGKKILMTSGVDGLIYFLDTEANVLSTKRPKTDKTTKLAGVIRHLVAGDFDGDGDDEVVSFINRKGFEGNCFMDITDLSTFQRPDYWKGESNEIVDNTTPGLGFTDKQLPFAYDMDQDGDEEIVAHYGVYHPEDGVGTMLFSTMIQEEEKLTLAKYNNYAQQYLKDNLGFKDKDKEKLTNTGKYLMQHGLPGNFDADAETELFTLYGDDLFVSEYNKNEKSLSISTYTWAHSDYHFMGIAKLEDRNGGPDKVVLAGPITGDDHFYVVDITDPAWKTQARKINGRGVLGEVNTNLDQLTDGINAFKAEEDDNREPIWYVSSAFGGWLGWDMTAANCEQKAQDSYDLMQEWYTKIGGNKNVRLAMTMNSAIYGETTQDENPKITLEGMIAFCKALAKKGVYFSLTIGHGNHPYMTPDSFAKLYEASIFNGECYMTARTKELKTPEYFDLYTPHLDAILAKAEELGTKPPMVMLCAKGAIVSAFSQEQGNAYFPKYKDILIPGVENSNVGVQDLSIQERAGLWLNGDVKNWGCNVIGDNIAPNRVAEWGGMRNAHLVLKQMLSQYALGARVFRITSVTSLQNPLHIRGDVTGEDQEWSQTYQKGVLNFLRIVEKGIYPHAQNPSEVKGVSPVAITLYNRSDRMRNQNLKHDHDLYTPASQEYVINQLACWDGYTDVPAIDLTAYTANAKRRWDNLIPSSVGGFVALVPHCEASTVEENEWCSKAFQTDGDSWENMSLQQGKENIINALLEHRETLPFYIEGNTFWQTIQKDEDNAFYMMVMDNSFITPKEGNFTIKGGSALTKTYEVTDQITGSSLGTLSSNSGSVAINIPKGSVRFLKMTATDQEEEEVGLNGDFEHQLINWEVTENVSATNLSHYGQFAALIHGNGSLMQKRKVMPNTSYTLSAFGRIEENATTSPVLSINDENGNPLNSLVISTNSYAAHQVLFTTTSSMDSVIIEYKNEGESQAFLDEVEMEETVFIRNVDFAKELLGWEVYGQVSVDDTKEIFSSNALMISEKGGASQWIKLVPATTYEVTFSTLLEDSTLQANFYIKDSNEKNYLNQAIKELSPTSYTLKFTTNEQEEDAKIGFWRGKNAMGKTWLYDLKIVESSTNPIEPEVPEDPEPEDPILSLEEALSKVVIYPNPAKEYVRLQVPQNLKIVSVEVYNFLGQKVIASSIVDGQKISTSTLTKGSYCLKLMNENGGTAIKKLIIK